jgi:hypothetical protein
MRSTNVRVAASATTDAQPSSEQVEALGHPGGGARRGEDGDADEVGDEQGLSGAIGIMYTARRAALVCRGAVPGYLSVDLAGVTCGWGRTAGTRT